MTAMRAAAAAFNDYAERPVWAGGTQKTTSIGWHSQLALGFWPFNRAFYIGILGENDQSMSARDEFRQPVIRQIAQRAGYRCSNPTCLRPTIGPDGGGKTASIGVAAHITAAAENGPRYDSEMTVEERTAAANGIWLCQTCSRLVDVDLASHSSVQLHEWKTLAEMRAYLGLRGLNLVCTRSFKKLEKMLPGLFERMRFDLTNSPLIRTFVAYSKTYRPPSESYFSYKIGEFQSLAPDSAMTILENYDACIVLEAKGGEYLCRFSEDFVEYLLMPV